jgi:hypothetical protein
MSSHIVNHEELAATGDTSNESTLNDAEDLPKKKPVSDRKVEANRRNAQKSTGPITPTGRKMVSRNAVRMVSSHESLSFRIAIQRKINRNSTSFELRFLNTTSLLALWKNCWSPR